MSETTRSERGFSRRGFLKLAGAAGAVGVTGGAGLFTANDWLKPAAADEGDSGERIAYTFHQGHCCGHCALKCTVRDGRLCIIQPNDNWDTPAWATVCLKGISEVQHVYSEERIQTPLKRVGERGSGEFEAISWDEALDIFEEEIKKVWDAYGHEGVLFKSGSEARFTYLAALLGCQTAGWNGVDVGLGNGFDPAFGGYGYGYASAATEMRDWINAKTLLNIGANFCESSLPECQFFFDAKEAGCNTITVDPNFSTTASKSDQWVPIKPGTDAALLLAMISVIIENGWQDESFMRANTSFPFLVSVDDGSLLQQKMAAVKAADGTETVPAGNLVYDEATKGVKLYSEAKKPALTGTFTVKGKKYRTVYDCLVENQKSYTTEWAAEVCGVAADTITELARQYATVKPATLTFGWGGGDKYGNADVSGHAMAILPALTGNMGKPGASAGIHIGFIGTGTSLGSWALPEQFTTAAPEAPLYSLLDGGSGIHAVIASGDMFLTQFANTNKTYEWMKTLDFICYIDIVHSSGANYADLILPVCTKLENSEEIGGISVRGGHLQLQEKVLDPLFESKTDFALQYEIAKRFGYEQYLPESAEAEVRNALATSPDPEVAKITVEQLVENHGIMSHAGYDTVAQGFTDQVYPSPTGKIEVYYESLVADDQALPNYQDPFYVTDLTKDATTYPLQMIQPRTRFHIHNQYVDAKWIRQFYDTYVELNPAELESRGLSDGDSVEVVNDRGSMGCAVHANAAVRPGVVRVYEGVWEKFCDHGCVQMLTNDTMLERGNNLMMGPVTPFNDTLVEIRKA